MRFILVGCMMIMENKKAEILEKVDKDYLQSIAISICNVPRYFYLYEDKNEIIKTLSNKLTKEQIMKIYRFFVMDYPPEETAGILKEPNGKDILFRLIENNKPFKTTDYFISEALIQGKRCDLVHINNQFKNLDAVEIKANGDKLDNAVEQCTFYCKWADKAWLLTSEKHFKKKTIMKAVKRRGIGLMIYSNNNIEIIWKPKVNELTPYVLDYLPLNHIKNIAKRNKLSANMKKQDLVKQLSSILNNKDILMDYRREISMFLSR